MAVKKPINIGLQGGGAHGAFTWGVLDRLLEHGRLHINAMTATSAGAMNAVVAAYGMHLGDADGAREKLEEFWRAVSRSRESFGLFDIPFADSLPFFEQAERMWTHFALESAHMLASPYQLNPLDFNPLRRILKDVVDFEALHTCRKTKLFISATNVQTGKARIFQNEEVSVDAVLASACLPQLFQAIEIDGQHYWDGGFMGNPSLWPLFYETDVEDLLVVHINPIHRSKIPTTPGEISNRINEITFNSALLKEMRAIAFVQKMLDSGWLDDSHKGELSNIRFHSIRAEKVFEELGLASKYDTGWNFLTGLRDRGREAASEWIEKDIAKVGKKSSVDLYKEFLDV